MKVFSGKRASTARQAAGSRRDRALTRRRLLAGTCAAGMSVALWPSAGHAGDDTAFGFEASYELHSRGMLIGRTRLALDPLGGGRYRYSSTSVAVGLAALIRDDSIEETSELRFDDAGLRSLGYRYRRDGEKRRVVEVDFDWERSQALNRAKGRTWTMPIPEGTLDKLNYLLAVMSDLERGQRDLRYPVADGGALKTFTLAFVGQEHIETSLGSMDTLVMRRTRKGGKRITTFWCAPKLRNLPVRVEHRERDGEVLLLKLAELARPVQLPTR